jgi:1-acyl-sn-glycerol-3-phosphate acyltransferase
MALRTGSPLVPAAILGTEAAGRARVPRRVRVRVVFGQPIEVDRVGVEHRRARAEALTREVRSRVAGLLGD